MHDSILLYNQWDLDLFYYTVTIMAMVLEIYWQWICGYHCMIIAMTSAMEVEIYSRLICGHLLLLFEESAAATDFGRLVLL